MGFFKNIWAKFRRNWIVCSFAVVGFFASLAEIWPILYLISPWLAVAAVLFYTNVVTFFGGLVFFVALPVVLWRVVKVLRRAL